MPGRMNNRSSHLELQETHTLISRVPVHVGDILHLGLWSCLIGADERNTLEIIKALLHQVSLLLDV